MDVLGMADKITQVYAAQIADEHRTWYAEDVPGAAFKMGQLVRIKADQVNKFGTQGRVGKITSVDDTGDGFEYTVEGAEHLLWETELETVDV
jgi:hypothetical protein